MTWRKLFVSTVVTLCALLVAVICADPGGRWLRQVISPVDTDASARNDAEEYVSNNGQDTANAFNASPRHLPNQEPLMEVMQLHPEVGRRTRRWRRDANLNPHAFGRQRPSPRKYMGLRFRDRGPPIGEGPSKIKYVSLVAERHSGSTWMVNFLQAYFGRKNLVVGSSLCTWKHWFQSRIHEGIQSGERSCRPSQPCPACHEANHTLVVVMWRNPYDWTTAMSQMPHHAKYHAGLAGKLSAFLTKRWMVPREMEVALRAAAAKMDPKKDFCVDNFVPSEVLPCTENDRDSIYELDPNGEPYENIYALRKAKIQDFNAIQEWMPMYERILYEDMLDVDNLRSWLLSLDSKYGLVGNLDVVARGRTAERMRMKMKSMYYANNERCAPGCALGVQRDAVETLNALFDEELESSIGYHKVS